MLRAGLLRLLGWALAGSLLGLGAPAGAVPVDVFFDGPTLPGDPETHFGLSAAQAEAARDLSGVPWLTSYGLLGTSVGTFEIDQSIQGFSPNPPTAATNRATSNWTAENVSGVDLLGASYLALTHTDPFLASGVLVDYADANVGVTIDADLGWVIVQAMEGGTTFYYPAVLLDRSVQDPLEGEIPAGGTTSPFAIAYVVAEPLVRAPADGGAFQLPELQIARVFTPVPEPASAALLAAGLVALALRGRPRVR